MSNLSAIYSFELLSAFRRRIFARINNLASTVFRRRMLSRAALSVSEIFMAFTKFGMVYILLII